MSKVTAPLLSFSASGQIAKTQVYSRWKGRPYVRRYAIPSNPNTTAQQSVRNTFKWLNFVWRYYPDAAKAAWALYALSRQITDRNAFIKQNLATLEVDTDLNNMIMSPAALSGLAPLTATFTPGASKITVAMTAAPLPTGWTVTAAHALAIIQQDPHVDTDYQVFYATDAVAPYSFDITGLTTGVTYQVGAWFEYLRADGTTAYGISFQGTAIPT